MKLVSSTSLLDSSGQQSSSAFKIRASAQAFRILSSGLYSEKINAVLREIGCNAADAHIAVGTPDLPIEVKLPGYLDPTFHIRDFGPGLSDEEIHTLYTTYFASSKSDSNDQTGAFGLGSKSPFSYTDQFSLISIHGGMKRTYAAYIGDTGGPTISLMQETPTDEHTGITMAMPVKSNDAYKFAESAQSIYQHFRIPPKIIGGVPIKPIEYVYQNALLKKPKGAYEHLSVIMGNVCYPIDYSKVIVDYDRHLEWFQACGRAGFHFELPIGAVSVAVSREHLEYTPETVAVLSDLMLKARDILLDEIAAIIAKVDTTFASANEASKSLNALFAIFNGSINYETMKAIFIERFGEDAYAKMAIIGQGSFQLRSKGYGASIDTLPQVSRLMWDEKRCRMLRSDFNLTRGYLMFKDATAVVWDDLTVKHRHTRPRQALLTSKFGAILLVNPIRSQQAEKSLRDLLAVCDFTLPELTIDQLDVPPRLEKAPGTVRPKVVRVAPVDKFVSHLLVDFPKVAGWNPPQSRIGDFPAESRAYITRTCSWGNYKGYVGGGGGTLHREYDLARLLERIKDFNVHFPELPQLTEIAIVTEGEAKAKKLREQGFVEVHEWYERIRTNATFVAEMQSDQGYDENLLQAPHYACATRRLLAEASGPTMLWNELKPYLKGSQLERFISDALAFAAGYGGTDSHTAQTRRTAATQMVLHDLLPRYTVNTIKVSALCKNWEQAHSPKLRLLNVEAIDTSKDSILMAGEVLSSLLTYPEHIKAAA